MDKCKLKSIIIAQLTVIYDQGGNTVYMMLPGEELWGKRRLLWPWSYGSWFLTTYTPITSKVVSWNPVHGEVYLIQHYVIKFVSDLWQVGGFLRVFRFPPPIKRPPRYNWNIVESGVKHYKPYEVNNVHTNHNGELLKQFCVIRLLSHQIVGCHFINYKISVFQLVVWHSFTQIFIFIKLVKMLHKSSCSYKYLLKWRNA